MTSACRISRRTFGAALALGFPAFAMGRHTTAQTPASNQDADETGDLPSSLVAVSPHELLDTLLVTPFAIRFEGEQFEPTRWETIGDSPYISSVGGVNIRLSGGTGTDEELLGAYGVYLEEGGTRAVQFLGKQAIEVEHGAIEVQKRDIGGHEGEVVLYDDGSPRTLTLVPVGNVLVLGYDNPLSGQGGPRGDQDGDAVSIGRAAVLIDHLRQLIERPT